MELLYYQHEPNPLLLIPLFMIIGAILWLVMLIIAQMDDPWKLKTRVISAISIPILLIGGIIGYIHINSNPDTYVLARLTEPVNATEFYSKYEVIDQYEDILKLRVKDR